MPKLRGSVVVVLPVVAQALGYFTQLQDLSHPLKVVRCPLGGLALALQFANLIIAQRPQGFRRAATATAASLFLYPLVVPFLIEVVESPLHCGCDHLVVHVLGALLE